MQDGERERGGERGSWRRILVERREGDVYSYQRPRRTAPPLTIKYRLRKVERRPFPLFRCNNFHRFRRSEIIFDETRRFAATNLRFLENAARFRERTSQFLSPAEIRSNSMVANNRRQRWRSRHSHTFTSCTSGTYWKLGRHAICSFASLSVMKDRGKREIVGIKENSTDNYACEKFEVHREIKHMKKVWSINKRSK